MGHNNEMDYMSEKIEIQNTLHDSHINNNTYV
jgi:hypothetical protein